MFNQPKVHMFYLEVCQKGRRQTTQKENSILDVSHWGGKPWGENTKKRGFHHHGGLE